MRQELRLAARADGGGAGARLRMSVGVHSGEYHLFLVPVIVGGGKRMLPDGVRLGLELVDVRRFDSGFVYLRYRQR